jgi:hypothetical protein
MDGGIKLSPFLNFRINFAASAIVKSLSGQNFLGVSEQGSMIASRMICSTQEAYGLEEGTSKNKPVDGKGSKDGPCIVLRIKMAA